MECGECTLCCELLPIKALSKPPNVLCTFCKDGCTIHGNHPEECKKFECAYYQMKKVNINLRPDKCKVIFEKLSDSIFFGTLHPEFEISPIVKAQIDSFGKQGFSTIISSTKFTKPLLFLSFKHNEEEIREEFKKYIENKIINK